MIFQLVLILTLMLLNISFAKGQDTEQHQKLLRAFENYELLQALASLNRLLQPEASSLLIAPKSSDQVSKSYVELLQTYHRNIIETKSKRGWEDFRDAWRNKSPKRGWEIVDKLWKKPAVRRKYKVFTTGKRSKERAENVSVESNSKIQPWLTDEVENGIDIGKTIDSNDSNGSYLISYMKRGWEDIKPFQERSRKWLLSPKGEQGPFASKTLRSGKIQSKRGWEDFFWKRNGILENTIDVQNTKDYTDVYNIIFPEIELSPPTDVLKSKISVTKTTEVDTNSLSLQKPVLL